MQALQCHFVPAAYQASHLGFTMLSGTGAGKLYNCFLCLYIVICLYTIICLYIVICLRGSCT